MNDVFDGSYTADGFFREDSELEGKSAGEFSFEIDRAAAHARDDAGVLDFWPFELNENDGLARPEKIGHDADDFEVEFFDLVASEDGVSVTLHARVDLAEGKDLGGGRGLSMRRVGRQCDCRCGDNRQG